MNGKPTYMTQEEKYDYLSSFGWEQCDYPYESAKDMWYHADFQECADGKYISTEEALFLYASAE